MLKEASIVLSIDYKNNENSSASLRLCVKSPFSNPHSTSIQQPATRDQHPVSVTTKKKPYSFVNVFHYKLDRFENEHFTHPSSI